MTFISPGRHSPLWKEWAKIGRGKGDRFFMEHPDAVLECLEQGFLPDQILVSEARYNQDRTELEALSARFPQIRWYQLPEQKLNSLSSVTQSQSLLGVFPPNNRFWTELLDLPFLIVGYNLADPGNLGTLVRTTSALTPGGLLLIGGCNPWSSKVARASAGSLFRLPVARVAADQGEKVVETLRSRDFKVFATFPGRGKELREVGWSGRDAVLLGNESHGVPASLGPGVEPISIPMMEGCESLNVAVAGAIIAYEWASASEPGSG